MIKLWLINAMDPEIGLTCLFLRIVIEVSDAVKETYSDMGNSMQVFEIANKIMETKKS